MTGVGTLLKQEFADYDQQCMWVPEILPTLFRNSGQVVLLI